MSTADNIRAFAKAEKAKKAKLLSVEKACTRKTAPVGKVTVKKPKKAVLIHRDCHATPAKSTVVISKWVVARTADRTGEHLHLPDPFLQPRAYFPDKKAADAAAEPANDALARMLGKGYSVTGLFRVVRVSVLVHIDA